MFVSVTRLRLRSWLVLFQFLRASRASILQAKTSEGFVTGGTLLDPGLVFWTLTVWESEAEMKAFRGAGAHREAMPYLRRLCSEAATTNWTRSIPDRPTWAEAHTRLTAGARFHTVDQPTANHQSHIIRPPSTARWRDFPM